MARRFPAGQWSIDFPRVDEKTGDFVVVELKRGKSSDAVMGQLARYMMWVTENLAKPGQKVRGIIVAREADEGLTLAVRTNAAISIKTYRESFMLTNLGKR